MQDPESTTHKRRTTMTYETAVAAALATLAFSYNTYRYGSARPITLAGGAA